MQEVISGFSNKERFKLLRKFWLNVIFFLFLVLIQMHYLIKVEPEERSAGGYMLRIGVTLFLEIAIVIREIKLRGFLKRNEKLTVTGVITKKEAHIRRGRNSTSYFYIELDNQKEYEFKNETLFDSLKTGMTVNLIFLEDRDDFTDLRIISEAQVKTDTSIRSTPILAAPEIQTGFDEREISLIKKARSKNFRRKSVFLIFFGVAQIPGLLLIIANPEPFHLAVYITLGLYLIYVWSIAYRFNKDLRKQTKRCSYSIVSDKLESDHILVKDQPEEFVKGNAFYIRCTEGLLNVTEETYSQCTTGTIVHIEMSEHSKTLLNVRIKQ